MKDEMIVIGGKSYKECNVIMLATDKETNIWKTWEDKIGFTPTKTKLVDGQHLYIFSNEEIKEGEWKYNERLNCVTQHLREGKNLPDDLKQASSWCKKIIATTDPSLTWIEHDNSVPFAKGKQHLLPRPSNDFLEAYCKSNGKIDKVLVEYDTHPTIGKIINNEASPGENIIYLKVSPDNTITIKPVQVKDSWNREEVIRLCKSAFNQGEKGEGCTALHIPFDKWIEKNL